MNILQRFLNDVAITCLAVVIQTTVICADAGAQATACSTRSARKNVDQLEEGACASAADGDGAAPANGAASALLSQMSARIVGERLNPGLMLMEAEEVPDVLTQETLGAGSPEELQIAAPPLEAVPPQPPLGPAVVQLPMSVIQPPNTSDASAYGADVVVSDGSAVMQAPSSDTRTASVAESAAESVADGTPNSFNAGANTAVDADNSTGASNTTAVAAAAVAASAQPAVSANESLNTRNNTDSVSAAATVLDAGSNGSSDVDDATMDNANGADASAQSSAVSSDTSNVADASAVRTDLDSRGSKGGTANTTDVEVATDAAAGSEPPTNGTSLANDADAAVDAAPATNSGAAGPLAASNGSTAALPSSDVTQLLNTSSGSSDQPRDTSDDTADAANITASVTNTAVKGAEATAVAETSIGADAVVLDNASANTESFSPAAMRLANMIQSIAHLDAARTSLRSMFPQWLKPPLKLLHEVVLQTPAEAAPPPATVTAEPTSRELAEAFLYDLVWVYLPCYIFTTLIAFFYWVHTIEIKPEAGAVANPSDFDHWQKGICCSSSCHPCSEECVMRSFLICMVIFIPSVRWADTVRRLGFTGFWFAFATFTFCRLFSTLAQVGVAEWLLLTVIGTGMRQEMRRAYGFEKKAWTRKDTKKRFREERRFFLDHRLPLDVLVLSLRLDPRGRSG